VTILHGVVIVFLAATPFAQVFRARVTSDPHQLGSLVHIRVPVTIRGLVIQEVRLHWVLTISAIVNKPECFRLVDAPEVMGERPLYDLVVAQIPIAS